MISDRLLQITLVVSIFVHGVIILLRANFNPFTPAPKVQEIAVRYIKENPQAKPLPKSSTEPGRQRLMPRTEPFLKLDAKIGMGNKIPPPYIEQGNSSGGSKALPDIPSHKLTGFSKPNFINSEVMAIKKKITLPAIEMAKIDNPSYISYYQIVREKIRRSAYQNYTHNEIGQAYVSFIISNDGYIKGVHLIEEKTTDNDYLKNVALSSIRDASPFPNFPKELDYPQLSFNIIISFEIE
ncbi:MAG: TonB C-terminal domain-containing protein [Candidatus Omnitrophota bacterium]|nr:TonB C-terminal domain-containing protein [Candidatus Omnitrophota bacterium]